ncbi:DUF1671-domain-containing protein [Hypoxylon fragiforme]|uniref:DUF1671-domain-containing protein n=1 Tax=Hypoxylon fragiforme TaxID=63214 RepID=UPI0020C681DC|nr:DUF1671-domain-containing protein [Hypoxylon fragiforme]KAI2608337.1 DUF1671-domain-containing protein [Hypoxylon fragiforme]
MSGLAIACPFCYKKEDNEYAMLLHLETQHCEGQSPFVVADEEGGKEGPLDLDGEGGMNHADTDVEEEEGRNNGTLVEWIACPVDGCGEWVQLLKIEEHIELHGTPGHSGTSTLAAAPASIQFNGPASESDYPVMAASRTHRRTGVNDLPAAPTPPPIRTQVNKVDLSNVKRLGKGDLGRYHREEKMPAWLTDLLTRRTFKSSEGIIPVLSKILQQNPRTHYAYLCHPAVQHISKLRREGSFCGYRNIQMVISYIVGSGATGSVAFENKIPSIFRIQDLIEEAWDQGINPKGRIETGGVRGTRKYIGTPEACTIFTCLKIPCEIQGFKNRPEDQPNASEHRLYDAVEKYFADGVDVDQRTNKVRNTMRPPLYFQHQGHSMTIVGIESRNGKRNLLVFDPTYTDPTSVTRYVGQAHVDHGYPDHVLKVYRRGPKYLYRYKEFEIL